MAKDFVRARRRVLASALAQAAGPIDVADELESGVRRGLSVNDIHQLALAVSQVTPAQIAAVAAADLDRRRSVVSVAATPEHLGKVMTALDATEPQLFDKELRSASIPPPWN
jgi:predicted Zn-dependent peptidase